MQATPHGGAPDDRRAPAPGQVPENELLRRYATERSADLRDELVRRFMPLARSLAMRYRRGAESLDDLTQVAALGLVKAVDGYDPARGSPFPAYAVPTILGELRRHFRDHVWNVRLPRGLQEMAMKVDNAAASLTEKLGRVPTATEISESLGVSVEDVLEAIEAAHARRTVSLDAPRRDEAHDPTPGVDMLPAHEPGFDRIESNLASDAAGLDEREWEVLRLRFVDELTQREIGDRLGVSQMQISRISRGALWKLLAAVRGDEGDAPPPASAPRRKPDFGGA